MIEFNHVHARYWRDQRGNPDAAIPVKGRDIVEREGRTYAVLFDADRAVVAVYQFAGAKLRLIRGDRRRGGPRSPRSHSRRTDNPATD